MKVALVSVCYNAYSDAIRFVESVKNSLAISSGIDLHFIMCDNSSVGDAVGLRETLEKYGFLYKKLDNIGYFPAFFEGVEELKRLGKCAWDYVIVSNIDLQLDVNFFSSLSNLTENEDVGVIAPSILSKQTGEDINPKIFKRPSAFKLKSLMYGFQNIYFYKSYVALSVKKAEARGKRKELHYSTGQPMYAAHGSVMIFTKSYFDKGATIFYPRFL